MLKEERINNILRTVVRKGSVTVQSLSKELEVTPETIRKDLEILEGESKLKRVHGGAVSIAKNILEENADTRVTINQDEKRALSTIAPEFVQENEFIALDDSTTNVEVAKSLVQSFNKLIVMTNSLSIARIFAVKNDMQILLASGRLNNEDLFTYGGRAVEFIKGFHPDIFFMSASGVTIEEGIMDYGFEQFEVKMAMKSVSGKTFCVADHTKFGQTATIKVCSLNDVDGIITDDEVAKEWKTELYEIGVSLFTP